MIPEASLCNFLHFCEVYASMDTTSASLMFKQLGRMKKAFAKQGFAEKNNLALELQPPTLRSTTCFGFLYGIKIQIDRFQLLVH
mmetsp:Transcript_11816/g.32765  ORF Transcript_11816/g.32765 Transcript_11816/m.32765 type:complete len:84 (+) Transcript_11816:1308-1559(+)